MPAALRAGYDLATVERVWEVLKAFGSFGFCKAHAAAFALPTFQSAWLKAHHPAAFLAGVLTHDPGMYPKRLILDDARQFGIAILGLDVNQSENAYRIERVGPWRSRLPRCWTSRPAGPLTIRGFRMPARTGSGWRCPTSKASARRRSAAFSRDARTVRSSDFWHRAGASRPIVERLVMAGAFDSLYGIGACHPGPAAWTDHPARSAASGRRARPVEPGGGARAERSPGKKSVRPTGAGVVERAAEPVAGVADRCAGGHRGSARAGPR